jgi:GAF domain-containing protein
VLHPEDAAEFARLSNELASEPDTEQTVQRVIELAQASIPGCDFAGFTLTRPDRLETAAATDPLIAVLDQAQHELAQGPCLEAAHTEETYLISNTETETRWPLWCARAAEQGIHSVLSVQLTGPDHLHAAMNLYSKSVDAFEPDTIFAAQIYAAHAGNAIAAANQVEQLQTALQTRLTETQAFGVLSRRSQEANVKLRIIASDLVKFAHDSGGRLP